MDHKRHNYYDNAPLIACLKTKSLCKLDEIGEYLELISNVSSNNYGSIVHEPKASIPSHRRIPFAMANNKTYIMERCHQLPTNGTLTALTEYNPTILPLYKNLPSGNVVSDIDDKLLDYLTGRYHESFTDEEANRVKYISVERSTNHHACGMISMRRQSEVSGEQCLFAFALLDNNLKAIPGAEVVVDFEYDMQWKRFNSKLKQRKATIVCFANDVTIFVAHSSKDNPKKDQLFLFASTNKEGTIIIPIDIRRTTNFIEGNNDWVYAKLVGTPFGSDMQKDGTMYGEGLQLRIAKEDRHTKPGNIMKWIRNHGGYINHTKNFHFFEADGLTYLETSPLPHTVESMNLFFDKGLSSLKNLNLFPNSFVEGIYRKFFQNVTHFTDPLLDNNRPSFQSFSSEGMKEIKKNQKFRGTTCCIDMDLDNEKVKVGVGHSVTKSRSYMSFFYAFESKPPFKIIAYSGYFCLGGMKPSDEGFSSHFASQQLNYGSTNLNVGNVTYNCPKVSFASGITHMVGDKDQVIISYRVSDCYSRSIIVSKEKIRILLKGTME